MGGASGGANAGLMKFSGADEDGHDKDAEHGTSHAVCDAEQVSKEEADYHDSGGGYKRSLFPAEQQKYEQNDYIAESELHAGDSEIEGNETFYISTENGQCGQEAEIRGSFCFIYPVHAIYQQIISPVLTESIRCVIDMDCDRIVGPWKRGCLNHSASVSI